MEYYSAIKKNEIKTFAATGMDLEIVILSEVSQREKDRYLPYDITYMWNLKKKKILMNLFPKQKEIHRHKKQIYGYQRGKGEG